MERIERIKTHYGFTDEDTANLVELRPLFEPHLDEFIVGFYKHISRFEDFHKFMKDEQTESRHKNALKMWLLNIFSGAYDQNYLKRLEHIGLVHVKVQLKAHYVNASMHYVKLFCMDLLRRKVADQDKRARHINSVEKILDINLDVLTSSYIEEERKTYFISERVESTLIQFSNRFSYGLNLVLVLGLVIMGLMVMGLFVYDLTHIFRGNIEIGLLSALGSLLMLWVVIELVNTEINHLQGEKFAIKIFVSVALVAVIRKILVTTISTSAEAISTQLVLIAAVTALGVVYWLIARVD